MSPADLRDATFESLRDTLSGRRKAVYFAWLAHGPATTRQLAIRSGIDILNVRPRTTELVTIGLVELHDSDNGEGIYRARSRPDWEAWFIAHRPATSGQLQMPI